MHYTTSTHNPNLIMELYINHMIIYNNLIHEIGYIDHNDKFINNCCVNSVHKSFYDIYSCVNCDSYCKCDGCKNKEIINHKISFECKCHKCKNNLINLNKY